MDWLSPQTFGDARIIYVLISTEEQYTGTDGLRTSIKGHNICHLLHTTQPQNRGGEIVRTFCACCGFSLKSVRTCRTIGSERII